MQGIQTLKGTCVGGDGPDLSRYPSLVFAPQQHGPGVRTHLRGASVEEIATYANINGTMNALDQMCAAHKITLEELLDALRYARDHQMA